MVVSCSTGPDADSLSVDRVEIDPASVTLHLPTSRTTQLSAVARTASGTPVPNRDATWASNAETVATVNSLGIVTAIGIGTALITASVDGATGTSTITVAPSPVASVLVSVDNSLLVVGGTATATAVLRDGNGDVAGSQPVTFSSSQPTVASVSASGKIIALGAGSAVITATSHSQAGTALVCVTPAAPNLRLNYVTLAQSTQTLSGSIPMISGGLPAEVRVYASNSDDFILGCPLPRFRVIAYDGTTEVHRAEVEAFAPLPRSSNPYAPITRFILPSHLITPSLRLLVDVDPSNTWTEADETDNYWPSSGTPASISVITVPALPIRFVPIHLESGGSTGAVDDTSIRIYLEGIRQMYPVARVDWDVGALLSTSVPFEPGSTELWLSVLAELNFRRIVEGSQKYYSGVISIPATINSSQFHGVGYIPEDLTTFEGPTRSNLFIGTGWILTNNRLGDIVAHELGHNHGRFHPPCGTGAGQDPGYPYPQGAIGVPGTDMYSYSQTGAGPFTYTSPFYYDFQGSCPTFAKWVSDYTYQALIAARQAAGPHTTTAARLKREECECLVVWGSVTGDSITLNPAFVTKTFAQVPTGSGSLSIHGVREDGSTAFSVSVEPAQIDHVPGVRHFAFAVPLPRADRESLTLVRATGRGRTATLMRPVAALAHSMLRSAVNQASFRLLSSGRGELQLPRTVAGALVRSVTTGEVLAISRGGAVTIDRRHAEVDVILSDGVGSETVRLRRSDASRFD
jgi:hypothetical protein